MTDITSLLDNPPPAGTAEFDRWLAQLGDSLCTNTDAWLEGPRAAHTLSKDRSWVLLSWIEETATRIARDRQSELLGVAAFAMSMLEHGPLDQRDWVVVGALLHRTANIAAIDFESGIESGCNRASELGRECLQWLALCPGTTPPTHVEMGEGNTFGFRRRPPEFDTDSLERWLNE